MPSTTSISPSVGSLVPQGKTRYWEGRKVCGMVIGAFLVLMSMLASLSRVSGGTETDKRKETRIGGSRVKLRKVEWSTKYRISK